MILEFEASEVFLKPKSHEVTRVSHLLYHGAKEPFQFSPTYQFNNPGNDGSFTLGEGLYLTDTIEHATDYSQVRQSGDQSQPVIYSVSAEQCRFLDLRGKEGNLPVPQEMVVKWRDYFRADLAQQKSQNPDIGQKKI